MRQAGTEFLIEHEAAGRMESRPPIVGVLEAPLQDADLDVRVLRGAHVVAQLRKVVADAPQAGLEVLGLVFVIVTAEYVKVLSGEVDDLLAPVHVVGPLLPARHDSRVGSNAPQAAAVDVHDFGIRLRREAVVHGLVVDLEERYPIGLGMSVGRPFSSPLGRRRVVEIADPVHGILDLFRFRAGCRQHDQGLGVELAAKSQELVCPEAVVV